MNPEHEGVRVTSMTPKEPNIVSLAPGKTDLELAVELRSELTPMLDKLCAVLNRARRAGLTVSFQLAQNAYGQMVVPQIDIVRPL